MWASGTWRQGSGCQEGHHILVPPSMHQQPHLRAETLHVCAGTNAGSLDGHLPSPPTAAGHAALLPLVKAVLEMQFCLCNSQWDLAIVPNFCSLQW